ncbi:MAG: lipase maturation factor family protein [Candidatus Hydrogenedens sp.]|nr:lipase maturation factor family protein [Candidatus Hydrogenedens sp.]
MEAFRERARAVWRALQGTPRHPRDYRLTRWLFLRALALVYLIAFSSLGGQIPGLIGEQGILPTGRFLDAVQNYYGGAWAYWNVPTLAWFASGTAALQGFCFAGFFCALLAVAGVLPRLAFFGCWIFYLTLTHAGQDFLSFQWDILLLETGLLAVFFAPGGWVERPHADKPVSPWMLWTLRLLLWKSMFFSGYVKLDDPTWTHLDALRFHYETQPLPHVGGWLAHQLPNGFQQASVAVMFFIELVAPFFLFGPRRVRIFGAGCIVALMALIAATGNYTFFNLLAVSLAVLWLDDEALLSRVPTRWREAWDAWQIEPVRIRRPRPITASVAVAWSACTLLLTAAMVSSWDRMPATARDLYGLVRPWYACNSYGLFRSMTTTRPEIELQGSNDGETWTSYRFRYKPGDLNRMPAWCQPHQPRLDWQMWFAALGSARNTPWFQRFVEQLLLGSPEVAGLLAENPFPVAPPKFIRALYWRYEFTTWGGEGWWTRAELGEYLPPVSLR